MREEVLLQNQFVGLVHSPIFLSQVLYFQHFKVCVCKFGGWLFVGSARWNIFCFCLRVNRWLQTLESWRCGTVWQKIDYNNFWRSINWPMVWRGREWQRRWSHGTSGQIDESIRWSHRKSGLHTIRRPTTTCSLSFWRTIWTIGMDCVNDFVTYNVWKETTILI